MGQAQGGEAFEEFLIFVEDGIAGSIEDCAAVRHDC